MALPSFLFVALAQIGWRKWTRRAVQLKGRSMFSKKARQKEIGRHNYGGRFGQNMVIRRSREEDVDVFMKNYF